MKINFLVGLIVLTNILGVHVEKSKGDILGVGSNIDKESISAITYGLADNSEHTIPPEQIVMFNKKPSMVDVLPINFGLDNTSNTSESPDIIEDITNKNESYYYNGIPNLRKQEEVNCSNYKTLEQCVVKKECGFCGSRNECIRGIESRPLQACKISTYTYYKGVQTNPNMS